jgi:hypothetical protein
MFFEEIIFPKVPLLVEVIKEYINLIEIGEAIPSDLKIKKIDCFTSLTSNNDYKIIINGDYRNIIEVSQTKNIWKCLIDLIKNKRLEKTKLTKQFYDYLNFNPNNLITSNTKYPLQAIIKQKDSYYYVPSFKGGVFTEKALTQRQKGA